MTDPAELALIDQIHAQVQPVLDHAVLRAGQILALDGDPGVAAMRMAQTLQQMVPADILAEVLSFALVRLAEDVEPCPCGVSRPSLAYEAHKNGEHR